MAFGEVAGAVQHTLGGARSTLVTSEADACRKGRGSNDQMAISGGHENSVTSALMQTCQRPSWLLARRWQGADGTAGAREKGAPRDQPLTGVSVQDLPHALTPRLSPPIAALLVQGRHALIEIWTSRNP
jgi:hypothetical protein